MTGRSEERRTGLCIVRSEPDAAAGLLITVTVRPDLDVAAGQSVLRTADVDEAVDRVRRFLIEAVCES